MIRKPETNGHSPDRATTEITPKTTPAVRSAAQKLRILAEYEAYPVGAPERGALLRREGIYTSHISKWRKQRDQGALQGLSAQRRAQARATRPGQRGKHAAAPRERPLAGAARTG